MHFQDQITQLISENRGVDLHIHSTESDGTFSPREIVERAVDRGLSLIALTDHDTVAGIPEALKAGRELGITVIPGVELSVEFGSSNLHMLGYGLHEISQDLEELLVRIREGRSARNPRIIQNLQTMGFAITNSEVRAVAGGDIIGRPHIAKVLHQKGYVASTDEAFSKFLTPRTKTYCNRWRPEIPKAVKAIRESGGIPVVAHPGIHGFNTEKQLSRVIHQLAESGILGVETYYTSHNPETESQLEQLTQKLDLVRTAGSDFHGKNKPNCDIGIGHDGFLFSAQLIQDFLIRYGSKLINSINESPKHTVAASTSKMG